MTEQEIKIKVMEKYPKLLIERSCAMERRFRQAAREDYAKKLRALSYTTKEGETR